MERVKVYGQGMPQQSGVGVFARALREAFPNLPIEEEGRLSHPALRENFIERVFAYARLRTLFRGRFSRGRVVAFHTAHKLQLMAHSPAAYRELGRRVAEVARAARRSAAPCADCALALGSHALGSANLRHRGALAGVRPGVAKSSRRRSTTTAAAPCRLVPITLIRHHTRHHAIQTPRARPPLRRI
jgi:hypothetical protein